MEKFIHIRSDKFPILPGEDEEIVNEGMYGKALAEYLQRELTRVGNTVPFVCAEDWGWWVKLSTNPIKSGVCIYALPETNPIEYVCTEGSTKAKKWSWSKFRFIDTAPISSKLHLDLMNIFERDPKVTIVQVTDDMPD